MKKFAYKLLHQDKRTKARLGEITTPHGVIKTPAFVPVGTQATVKSLTPEDLESLGVELFFVNTYHAYLRPGLEVIKKFGGLHKFMHWDGPIITDSGGFQVFSLARNKKFGSTRHDSGNQAIKLDQDPEPILVKISEDGVEFQSHWDGTKHLFTPESSMEYQWVLGSDIHIAFDECAPFPTTHEYAQKAMERTHRWAVRSLEAHKRYSSREAEGRIEKSSQISSRLRSNNKDYQALYGVVQGSVFEDLRKESAKVIAGMDFDGIAIGGVAVGESKKDMVNVLDWTVPLLPDNKPRHLLGVGEIDDIFEMIERGIDTFDCVQPTRLARMGRVFVRNNQISKSDPLRPSFSEASKSTNDTYDIDLMKKNFAEDMGSIDPACRCYTCQNFSRAYLHHLFHVRELLGYRLATIHNIHFVNALVFDIRTAIGEGSLLELKKQWVYNR